jgi:hypothetical protein
MSMEEMFNHVIKLHTTRKSTLGYVLESDIPLKVDIIYLDKGISEHDTNKQKLCIQEVDSEPMVHFWKGILREGWPMQQKHPEVEGFRSLSFRVKRTKRRGVYSDISFRRSEQGFYDTQFKDGLPFCFLRSIGI